MSDVTKTMQRRSLTFERAGYDKENRTVTLSFASETPVRRWYGNEILSCDPKNIDLSRLTDSAPLLLDHDPERENHIGVIRNVEIKDKVCRASCLLSQRDDVKGVLQDIEDGILTKASVGYMVTREISNTVDEKTGERTITWAWMPYEISLVAVPADTSVGVGRSAGVVENKTMSDTKVDTPAADAPAKVVEVVKDNSAEVRKATSEILKLGRAHNCIEQAEKAIESGKSVDQFRAEVLEVVAKRSPAPAKQGDGSIGLSEKDVQRYSFTRAINALCGVRGVDAQFELEVSDAAAKSLGQKARGLIVPLEVVVGQKRDFTVAGTGSNMVQTTVMADRFIDLLYPKMAAYMAGASVMSGLVGDVALPKETAGVTGGWVTEGNETTESEPTIAQVTGTPHTVSAWTDISRKLLKQSSVDAEARVRNSIARKLAIAIDAAAINGSGAAGQPLGLLGTTGINNPSISSAGSATYAEILAFLSDIATDNAEVGALRWVMTPEVVGNLAARPRGTGDGFILDIDTMRCIGLPVVMSTNIPANTAILGVWPELTVGMWGGLDINVDTASLSTKGGVRVVGLQDVDIMVTYPEAFAYNSAVTT